MRVDEKRLMELEALARGSLGTLDGATWSDVIADLREAREETKREHRQLVVAKSERQRLEVALQTMTWERDKARAVLTSPEWFIDKIEPGQGRAVRVTLSNYEHPEMFDKLCDAATNGRGVRIVFADAVKPVSEGGP